MAASGRRSVAIALTLLFLVVLVIVYHLIRTPDRGIQIHSPIRSTSIITQTQDIVSILRDPVPADNFSTDPFTCIEARYKKVQFPMCLYSDKECKVISKAIRKSKGQMFELDDLDNVVNSLEMEPEIGLIDIGANIGTYTLPAAHLGHNVVAVEMNIRTANRLMASISKGGIKDKVSLHQVAVSNVRERLRMMIKKSNAGDARLVNEQHCTDKGLTYFNYYCDEQVIKTILLDDLLLVANFTKAVLKIDVQGSEWLAFQNASKLFNNIDIQMILLEWDDFYGKVLRRIAWDEMYGTNARDKILNAAKKRDILRMANFFLARGYIPYDKYGRKYDTSLKAMLRWPYNIFFKKERT